MRATIAVDDGLFACARTSNGVSERSALIREALEALIEREIVRRLARLGGTEPDLGPVLRRRAPAA